MSASTRELPKAATAALKTLSLSPGDLARDQGIKNISNPIGSMYGIFTDIWMISMINVGKYTIHGSYGK